MDVILRLRPANVAELCPEYETTPEEHVSSPLRLNGPVVWLQKQAHSITISHVTCDNMFAPDSVYTLVGQTRHVGTDLAKSFTASSL